MMNRLFSWIFSTTACSKSLLTTDGQPLCRSSCAFSHPSLKCLTHLHTMESLMGCSPYTTQSCRLISAALFLAFKIWITDRISHVVGFSIFLNIVNTQDNA
jgi:hypothetical protein